MSESLVSRFGAGGVTIADVLHGDTAPTFTADGGVTYDDRAAEEVVRLAEYQPDPIARMVAGADRESDQIPYNAVTGAEYRGKNIERLLSAEILGNYGPGGWAGFKQWLTVGRVVRKGEHGTSCVTVIGTRESSEDTPSEPIKGRRSGGVRGFRVFHYDQTTEVDAEPIVRDPGEDMADRWNESR